jgi:N-acetylglucosamine malate deacetylase 1
MNPYYQFVHETARLLAQAKTHPLAQAKKPARPEPPKDAPTALFFSPHPDDECISGGPAVRIAREAGMRVFNVAVTQGSKKERQQARFQELQAACDYIGFGLIPTGPSGLEKISPKGRQADPENWKAAVRTISKIVAEYRPRVVMFPHERDWNSTHIGTHLLLTEALSGMPVGFECFVIETEFWGAMDDPNLMVEMSEDDVADMITALTFHIGEVQRNPYHLSLSAWMMDNVRRGGELVGGQGGAAPDFSFAVLNRLRRWRGGRLERFYEGGRQVARTTNIGELFRG